MDAGSQEQENTAAFSTHPVGTPLSDQSAK